MSGSHRAATACVVTLAGLAAYNVARALGSFSGWETVAALAGTAALLVVAVGAGLDRSDLGLDPADARRGAVVGGVALAAIVGVVGLAAAIPATRGLLDDSRGDLGGGELVVEILVGILLTTAIPEELAFRGVLLGAARRAWGTAVAVVVSSVAFGLWHIAPTLHTVQGDNALASTGTAAVGTVIGTVLATTVAGAAFALLRLRSRSVLAPVVAHLGTNAVALTAAWLVRG